MKRIIYYYLNVYTYTFYYRIICMKDKKEVYYTQIP